jgi:putative oxidoreductase
MNWNGTQQGEGFEFHLLMLGLSAAIVMTGGRKYAVDRLFADRLNGKRS